ncbi:hypothetical protein Tco_1247573 [Tanacetum coccineum]
MARLVKHGLEKFGFESIGNNDKRLSESQLDNEMVDRFVEVVVKVVLECRHGKGYSVRQEWLDVLHFHTCLTDILGFLEKLGWWFEQDIDIEEGRFEGDEDGGEVYKLGQLKAIDREVNDTEKEANSKEFVPSWITLDEEETFWEGKEDELE